MSQEGNNKQTKAEERERTIELSDYQVDQAAGGGARSNLAAGDKDNIEPAFVDGSTDAATLTEFGTNSDGSERDTG